MQLAHQARQLRSMCLCMLEDWGWKYRPTLPLLFVSSAPGAGCDLWGPNAGV